VVCSDPGWIYTEGAFGKIKGPVPIEFGVSQILRPLIGALSLTNDASSAELQSVFPKEHTVCRRTNAYTGNDENRRFVPLEIQLQPCGHIISVELSGKLCFFYSCPVCSDHVESRNIIDYDTTNAFVSSVKKYGLTSKDILNIVLSMCSLPLIKKT